MSDKRHRRCAEQQRHQRQTIGKFHHERSSTQKTCGLHAPDNGTAEHWFKSKMLTSCVCDRT
jgi:hypothetical protein